MPEKFQDRNEPINRPKEVKSGSETDPNKPVDRLDTKSEQKREDFLKQNETLIDTLIKWLGDGRDAKEMKGELLAMIARESNFQVEAKSGTGSRGLMQLTTNPLKDMSFEPWVGRWDKYKEYFQKSAIACTEAGKQSGYHLMGALEKMNNLSGIKLSKKQQMIDRTLWQILWSDQSIMHSCEMV